MFIIFSAAGAAAAALGTEIALQAPPLTNSAIRKGCCSTMPL
jgi:hypothetical protein